MDNRNYDIYKNYIMMDGSHIYQTASDMAMEKMCAYTPADNAFTHWKCLLRCCIN